LTVVNGHAAEGGGMEFSNQWTQCTSPAEPVIAACRFVPECPDQTRLVYGWFTEGFDTFDLKAAQALVGELAS
jgi:hypothetical protein